ncbi:MAG TPA: molybdenum cofactor guanylyltransferase [Opitutaceae bacterium]
MRFAGVVLVGGASRRMGRDKALLTLGGETLLARQVRVLREAGAGVVFIAGRRERRHELAGTRFVADAPGAEGPIAGLLSALAACRATHLAAVAVDLPRLSPAFLQRLWARCGAGRGAVAVHAGSFEPLAAIYPREITPLLAAAVSARRFSLQAVLRFAVARGLMVAQPLAPAERHELFNTNTPDDLRRAREGTFSMGSLS